MSLEEELAELSTVYQGTREDNQALRQLVKDYDAFIAEIAPYTHKDGRKAKALQERMKELGIE